MSSCLSGGGRAYRLDLEIIKSPSTSWASNSSSPSSTLTESSNSTIAISTRKPRTPRKRPNQTYNEAAAILSAACPKIFPTKHLTKPFKFNKPHNYNSPFPYEPADLFMPFQVIESSGFLLHPPLLEKPSFSIELKRVHCFEKPCQSPGEINSSRDVCDYYKEDFDAESILDEEIEKGIDSIIGKLSTKDDSINDSNDYNTMQMNSWCYGFPVGLGFGGAFGRGARAMKNVDERDRWRFHTVNVQEITPKIGKIPSEKKKKKGSKAVESKNSEVPKLKSTSIKANKVNSSFPKSNAGLLLKLNYDGVLDAWSNKGCPFSGEVPVTGDDVQTRLEQIVLLSERDASVLHYKEKRRPHPFSKKILFLRRSGIK